MDEWQFNDRFLNILERMAKALEKIAKTDKKIISKRTTKIVKIE